MLLLESFAYFCLIVFIFSCICACIEIYKDSQRAKRTPEDLWYGIDLSDGENEAIWGYRCPKCQRIFGSEEDPIGKSYEELHQMHGGK